MRLQAEHAPKLGRWVFYHLLRPELVRSLPNPLSSDVFLGWVRGDPEAKKFEEHVKAASRYLHAQVIPAFAKRIEERPDETLRLPPAKFIQLLHANGINCRHLGAVRSHCAHPGIRKVLATEVVSRVLKNDIAFRLRSKMAQLGHAGEAPYQHVRNSVASCMQCLKLLLLLCFFCFAFCSLLSRC